MPSHGAQGLTGRLGRAGWLVQCVSLWVLLFLLPFSKAAIEIAFGFLLGGWLLQRLDPNTRCQTVWLSSRARLLLGGVAAYLAICALSIVVSDAPWLSLRGFVGKWLEYLVLFLIVADLAASAGQTDGGAVVRRGLWLMAASASAVVAQGLGQELFIHTRPSHYDQAFIHNRMMGPYENPIDLATYFMVLIPVLMGLWKGQRARGRVAVGVVVMALIVCLIRTQSQGAWIGSLGGFGILVLVPRWRKSLVAAAVVGLVLLGGVLAWQGAWHALVSKIWDAGASDRMVMWRTGWAMVQDRPLLGHGVNTFMANYLGYWWGGEPQPRYAHNCFLQVMAESGVLGLVTFGWVLGLIMWLWWRATRAGFAYSHPSRWVLLGLGSGLAAFLVQSGLDTNFYALRQAALFWTLAGLLTGVSLAILQGHGAPDRSR